MRNFFLFVSLAEILQLVQCANLFATGGREEESAGLDVHCEEEPKMLTKLRGHICLVFSCCSRERVFTWDPPTFTLLSRTQREERRE